MANDNDADFFSGGGLGYFPKRKKKSKDSQIYGVFAEDADEDRDNFRPSVGSRPPDFSKPMNFVSGGVVDASNQQAPAPAEVAPAPRPKKRKAKERTGATEEALGAWEKTTKGIGSKLLQKMGWTGGGLGKTGQGLAVPIAAVKRSARGGLTEDEYMGVTREDWRPDEEAEDDKANEESEEEEKYEPAWKKGQTRKKVTYKLAGDVEPRSAPTSAPKQLIVDMRGPSVRVVSGFDQLNKTQTTTATLPKSKFLPELQHNINHLTDLKAGRIHMLEQKRRRAEDTIASLKKERKTLVAHADAEAAAVQRLQNVVDLVSGCVTRFREQDPALTLDTLIDLFKILTNKYQPEFRSYHLDALAYHIVFPMIHRKLKDWNPLSHPEYGVSIVKQWRPFFAAQGDKIADEDDMPEDEFGIMANRRVRKATKDISSDLYSRLLFEIIFPKFRTTVTNDWRPKDPDQLIRLLDLWADVLPTEFHDLVLDQLVLTRLRTAIEEWNPRKESVPIHLWLHPWLPMFGSRLEVLYDTLVKKLTSSLQAWDPTDSSALAVLKPWKGILSDRTWESLMLRAVVPRLLHGMKLFQINPANQDLAMFRAVLAWVDLIPLDHIVLLLDVQFFSKWLYTLQLWLSRTPNFDEVTQWYLAWKNLFPPALLQHERIQHRFSMALKLLDQVASNPLSASAPPPFVPPPDPVFRPVTAPSATSSSRNPEVDREQPSRPPLASDSMTFREVVERAAEEHDLLLLPTKKTHDGKPVFLLGNATVLLEREVVFQWKDGAWQPVSLEKLLEEQVARAKEKQKL